MKYPRSETELLLRCVSPGKDSRRAERIRALSGQTLSGQTLDWDFLLHMATAHAVSPLLYWGLKTVRPEAIPDSLAQTFRDNTRNSVHLAGELLQLMDMLAGEGIRTLAWKGPTLAVGAYGNLALRQFLDLDLLVSKGDAPRARDLLLARGYRRIGEVHAKWEAAYLRAYDEFALLGPDGFPLVELHWAVTPRYFSVPLDIEPFWDRAISVNLGLREVATLCAEDLLLVLCLHGAKHGWPRLSMVADVAWVMAAGNRIRWDEVLEQARRLHSLRMLLLGTELAGRLLEVPLPEPVSRRIDADRAVQALAAEVGTRLCQSPGGGGTIMGAGAFHMKARERWQDRVRYFVRLATTVGVEDWQIVDLPKSAAFLYPLLRFPRLLRKYWMRIP